MDPEKPAVFFQHGGTMSAATWLKEAKSNEQMFFRFIDAGHHVYLGNQRGTTGSQGHDSLVMAD